MHLVYLLFLLHLSSAACASTSRNHHLPPTAATPISVPAPAASMMTFRRLLRDTMHSLPSSYYAHVQDPTTMTMKQQQWPSPPPQPGANLARHAVEEGGVPPAERESAAMMVMTPPPGDGGGVKGAAGGAEALNCGGGSSDLITDDQPERDAVDIIDYVPPKTHPPSHN